MSTVFENETGKPIDQLPRTRSRSATGDSYVIQSNSLARSSYSPQANIHALRMLTVAMAKVDRGRDMLGQIEIERSELRDIFPGYASTRNMSAFTYDASERLMSTRAEQWTSDGGWKKINVISDATYNPKTGSVLISFHKDIANLLLKLTTSYTRYPLKSIRHLTTTNQVHLYQFLRSHAHHGTMTMKIEDVRKLFVLGADEYLDVRDLRRRVIEPAVEALNEKTDSTVKYEMVKRGRTITDVKFTISIKKSAESELDEMVRAAAKMLAAEGFDAKRSTSVVLEIGAMAVLRAIAFVKHRMDIAPPDKPIRDSAAYLARILTGAVTDLKPTNEDAYEKRYREALRNFRLAVYELMPADQRARLLENFGVTLDGRDKADYERFKAVETPSLRGRFAKFLEEYISPENPKIIIKS